MRCAATVLDSMQDTRPRRDVTECEQTMTRFWRKGGFQPGANDEMIARAAHLYYLVGLTQGEIAKRMNSTRFKVHRLLAQAREQGLVRVEIDVPFASRIKLEADLVRSYELDYAFVCPAETTENVSISEIIGQYSATIAAGLIKDGGTVATSWGETLHALGVSMEQNAAAGASVVSMIGSLSTRSSKDRYEAAAVLASRLGAECFYLPGPILCDTVEARDAINAQPAAMVAIDKSKSADIALLSIGGRDMKSLCAAGVISEDTRDDVVDAGAIGNFLGRFIGKDGAPIDHELNTLSIGVGPDDILDIPCRVLCAGGAGKVDAIRAVLERRLPTMIITDEATARELLGVQ